MMSSKEKDNPLSKIRQFFRASKSSGGALRERELLPELRKELRPETPVAQRCKALKELGDLVLTTRLKEASLKELWDLTKDLIVDNKSTEHRQTTLTFYRKLIEGQYENLYLMREHFFLVIQNHEVAEDLRHRLELLRQLTDNGKDITYFEEKIGKFMLQWAPTIIDAGLMEMFFEILVNIIKFNAAHLDNDILVGIVEHACNILICNVDDTKIGQQCLQVLDTVICYAIFPNETLTICIITLCRTVNEDPYLQASWKIMKNLLGTYLGHESMIIMCNILRDKALHGSDVLIRGAIFHINMGVWGSNSSIVPMFRALPSKVLLSYLQALNSQKIIVTYEVILSIQMMIAKCGKDLAEYTWDIICDILFAIADNIEYYECNGLAKDLILQRHFRETIDTIEKMLQNDDVSVNPDRIYNLIEKIAEDRPEISILNLIEYRSSKIISTRPDWLYDLNEFIKLFFNMTNVKIRVKAIQSLIQIMDNNRGAYEEEILERVVLLNFSNSHQEPDINVRTATVKALIDFTWHCDTNRCIEMLNILENILNRPFENHANDGFSFKNESDIQDILTVVEGLIKVFMVKLYRLPSNHAIKIFNILIGHLEQHYRNPKIFEMLNGSRFKIFNWMLKARANRTYHIGFPDVVNPDNIRFSDYLGIDSTLPHHVVTYQQQLSQSGPETIPPLSFTSISIKRACKAIVLCLETEKDYYVAQLVLKELPNILQNKALVQGNDIEALASTLFKIFFDKKFVDCMIPFSSKPTSDDFHALVLPAIASLVIYHNFLPPKRQQLIIEALKIGIPSRIARICINTLTIMILEMPEALMRQLPDVLLEMSKMSDTVTVAISVLEFLSILSRLPNHLFANFVPRQYMYVFAISLPYTKPHRYDHYTVSLAHHVIAGWFLKCKLALRKNFVGYIIASIQSNAHLSFEDVKVTRNEFSSINEDSSNRKRSSSLTERGSRGRERPSLPPQSPNSDLKPLMNESLKIFHMELAETCIDFIARHTFSPCSALPKRLPTVEYLLKGAPSQTWLVGNNLITVTTSGCSSIPTRNGLCDRCFLQCKNMSDSMQKSELSAPNTNAPNSPEVTFGLQKLDGPDFQQNRRYTKATLQCSSGTGSGSTELNSSTSSSSQQQNHTNIESRTLKQTLNNEVRFSGSSGSLETLSRRGSNPDAGENRDASVSSLLGTTLQQQSGPLSNVSQQICACSCTGWAEVYIRRPTGCISWIMRIQNSIANECLGADMPLHDLITLFMPSLNGVLGENSLKENEELLSQSFQLPLSNAELQNKKNTEIKDSEELERDTAKEIAKNRALRRQEEITSSTVTNPIDIPKNATKHRELAESLSDADVDEENVEFEDDDSKSRNPVRRVNSSPEMSSNWRSPFMNSKQQTSKQSESHCSNAFNTMPTTLGSASTINIDKDDSFSLELEQQQKKKVLCKDMRVSCEAIPEEIPGSTPPSLTESLKDVDKNNEIINSGKNNIENNNCTKTSIILHKQNSGDDIIPCQKSPTTTIDLKIPLDQTKVTTKPPQTPTPLSPRLLAKNAANKIAGQTSFAPTVGFGGNTNSNGNGNSSSESNGTDLPRGRSKTISVVREVNRNTRSAPTFRPRGANPPSISKLSISPSFIFLQLYHTGQYQVAETPIKISQDNMKAVILLDLIPPFETHKIGVLYVGSGQCNNEIEILRNRCGSARYVEFLKNLGTLVSLKDAKENNLFINMETDGRDGKSTYVWKDDIVHVTFHVATLMPNNDKDVNCTEKKKHIGNDHVSIVYNESGEDYSLSTIKGQFNYACVVVQPLELNSNRIFVRAKDEIAEYVCHSEAKIVSDGSAPLLARQLALHANLASLVSLSLKHKNPYASNWLERLRKIKALRSKLLKESQSSNLSDQNNDSGTNDTSKANKQNIYDFTKYT